MHPAATKGRLIETRALVASLSVVVAVCFNHSVGAAGAIHADTRPLSTFDMRGKSPPTLAAAVSNAECIYWGSAYFEGKGGVAINKEAAFRWFLKAAELGDAKAQLLVSLLYASGDGTQRDLAQAERWALAALERDVHEAPLLLFMVLSEGNASATRIEKTISALEKAAARGHSSAQMTLAAAFEEGKLVPSNVNKAVALYKTAAANGEVLAKNQLSSLAPV